MAMKNPYKDEISFAQLAKDDPDYAKILKPNKQIDFSDPASVLQLTKSLLKRDFGLTIELPSDRLCPPVPNRLNYLLWIDALLRSSVPFIQSGHDISSSPERKVSGLDIGTGASAIYPLLGCASNPSWSFTATDIDETSIEYARKNVNLNNLSSRITTIHTIPDSPLIPLQHGERVDFVMCNPPFYSSNDELEKSASSKSKPPNSTCTGSANEMVCKGGEIAFITRIIDESLELRECVQWYTSMVGKLSSLIPLIEKIRKRGCTNWAVGELVQGSKTRRWVLAWSWMDWRPDVDVARGLGAGTLEKKYLPFPSEYRVILNGQQRTSVIEKVNNIVKGLSVRWKWDVEKDQGFGFAKGNVWGRSARRKKKTEHRSDRAEEEASNDAMIFGFQISVEEENGKTVVLVKWIKGQDSVLFESFCGMIKRVVETEPTAKRKAEDTPASDVVKKNRQ